MKSQSVLHQFSDVTAKLEDLHAIAVEGQCGDNSPDMDQALFVHLRSGVAALQCVLQEMANALHGEPS